MMGNCENSVEGRENLLGKEMTVEESKNGGNEENSYNDNGVTVAVASVCRNLTVNRWPQQETMALLKIRSDMDVLFKDSGIKAPLWDEVSRRMAELGYHRSAKKCREKFENIHKYHKRRKTCSSPRSIAKTYRFSNQLEAFDQHQISLQSTASERIDAAMKEKALAVTPISCKPPYLPQIAVPISLNFESPITTSTSNTSSSGSESEGTRNKKRKWAGFFDRLMKSVLEKQADLQSKFLEAIDKCERERLAREEAWKMQEIERIKKAHELLMQERSISAVKDAAVLAFLQKISDQGKFSGNLTQMMENETQEMSIVCKKEKENGENSSSRWPKEEVEALIRIKSNKEPEHQRMGPLWEDVSVAMKNIGYDRSAKRCKEKWENINKYYRRVKDSSKQRPVDAKTCPYFHLLDSMYNMKTTRLDSSSENSGSDLRPEELLVHMMKHQSGLQQQGNLMTNLASSQISNHNHAQEAGNEGAGGGGSKYQTVANNTLPVDFLE